MIFSLRKPPYFSSRARGVSQWKMVTNGRSPGEENVFLMLSTTLLLKENVVHYCTYGEVHVVLMIHKL